MSNEKTPVAIESITMESLKGKSVSELDELHRYMHSIRQILVGKMEIVAAAKEHAEELERAKRATDKMSPTQRAALAQALSGDHVAKDEKMEPGASS